MHPAIDGNFITSSDMLEKFDNINSPMRTFYRNKIVFLTGGTGFFGKLFIEKLLSCNVKEIIVLIRPKKNKTPFERLEEMLKKEPVFTRFKHDPESYFKKIKLMEGDMKKHELGLSNDDLQYLIDSTQIVLHAAADVRFDESLKESIETNIKGTKTMLTVSKTIKNLEIFVYISTAYSNCIEYKVEERFYKSPLDPDLSIKLLDHIDDKCFDILTEKIIYPWPNTYAFAKAVTEDLVRRYSEEMLIAIIRPSIVTATYEDPIPGWTDNVYGVNGVITGAGVGLLRTLHIYMDYTADIIPADTVINSTLAVAWHTVKQKSETDKNVKIFNCITGADNPITWGDINRISRIVGENIPPLRSLWVALYNPTESYYMNEICKFFYHFIPALIIDMFLKLKGRTPRVLKIYRKVNKFSSVISFFTTNQWSFENMNMRGVYDDMSSDDHKFFPCDIKLVNWLDFFNVYIQGLRQYIVGENSSNLREARIRWKRLGILHFCLLTVIYFILSYCFLKLLKIYGILDFTSSFQAFSRHYEAAKHVSI